MSTAAPAPPPRRAAPPKVARPAVTDPADDRRRYRMTEARYLAFEEAQADLKHEWTDGNVIEMSGATEQHEDVAAELLVLLRPAARAVGGKAHGSNLRVRTGAGTRRYPDATAVLGEGRFAPHPEDKRLDLLNPAVVVEVLSDSTADTDEGPKLAEYTATPSVTDYVLADGRSMRVVHRARTGPGEPWSRTELTDPAAALHLPALNVSATLAEIYEGVSFGPAPE